MGRALLICDMWDVHWCADATRRTASLAERINDFAASARARGTFVIHAPSDCIDPYRDTAARDRMRAIERVSLPPERALDEPPVPVTKRPGCPDEPPCTPGPPWPWRRQHDAIRIDDADGVSDVGAEIYRALLAHDVEQLLFCGVHADICILDRPFGIRQMRRWGVECALVGDLTEPFWPDETSKVLAHIDAHLCPVIESQTLT